MKTIATLTMNPAIDVAYEADRVFHTRKIRARQEHYDPGGGGINVSRVIARLGGTARAYYLSGGATGATLDRLLDIHQMVRSRILIAGDTRISTSVFERETAKEYRFVPRGPTVSPSEWQACLDHLDDIKCDILVASGSLPEGAPDDFYCRVQAIASRQNFQLILDSSGSALRASVASGGLYLIKPSLGELEQLAGHPLEDRAAIASAAAAIVRQGQAQYVAVTLGRDGAMLAQDSGVLYLPAIAVETNSAVGAGDSFLAAMTFALACDQDVVAAFRYGIAAGAATILTPGTGLCHRDDVERLYRLSSQVAEHVPTDPG